MTSTTARRTLVLVALALICCSCQQQRAGIFGDSITAWGSTDLHAAFDPHFDTTVDGTPSAPIAGKADAITSYAATTPDVFVLNVGSNDALACSTTISADWQAQMAKLPASTIKVGVTVVEHAGWSPCMNERAAALNATIRLGAWLGYWRLVDWAKTVDDYTAAGSPFGPILSDGLHPSALGYQRLAQDEIGAATA